MHAVWFAGEGLFIFVLFHLISKILSEAEELFRILEEKHNQTIFSSSTSHPTKFAVE